MTHYSYNSKTERYIHIKHIYIHIINMDDEEIS